MAAWVARWFARGKTTDPMVARQLWAHAAQLDRRRHPL